MENQAYIYTYFHHNLLSHAVVKAHISDVVVFNIHFLCFFISVVSFVLHANGQICTLRAIHIKITITFFTINDFSFLRILGCSCYLVLGVFLLLRMSNNFSIVFSECFVCFFIVHDCTENILLCSAIGM